MSAVVNHEDKIKSLIEDLFPESLLEKEHKFEDKVIARGKIHDLEKELLSRPGEQTKIKTSHRFVNGLYIREVFIPKHAIVSGKIHRGACVAIMTKGDVLMVTEESATRLRAPFATLSRAGLKRLAFALEDTVWTTIHATSETDLEKVEAECVVDDYDQVEEERNQITAFLTDEGVICPS